MSNRKELRNARRKVAEARRSLEGIIALPRHVGSQVTWSNGVVWTRAGDDAWLPWSEDQPEGMPERTYESAHVASGTIVRVVTNQQNGSDHA